MIPPIQFNIGGAKGIPLFRILYSIFQFWHECMFLPALVQDDTSVGWVPTTGLEDYNGYTHKKLTENLAQPIFSCFFTYRNLSFDVQNVFCIV